MEVAKWKNVAKRLSDKTHEQENLWKKFLINIKQKTNFLSPEWMAN